MAEGQTPGTAGREGQLAPRAATEVEADAGPRVELMAAAGTLVLVAVVIVLALPRAVQPGDAGEFATVMLRGGVPHPPGYPWMRAIGWLARPCEKIGAPAAVAAALPCALLAMAGLLALQRATATRSGPWPASVALGLVATAPLVVRHVYDAEVWGPLFAVTGALLWLLTRTVKRPERPQRAFVVGLVLGLAVTVHLTAVLWVPLAIGAVWPGRTETEPSARRPLPPIARLWPAGLAGVLGSAAGLLTFTTLALGSGGPWRWGDTRSMAGLLRHITRADYGVFALSLHTERPSVLALWRRHIDSLADALTAGASSAPRPPLDPASASNLDPGAALTTALAVAVLALVMWGATVQQRRARVQRSRRAMPRPVFVGLLVSVAAHSVGFVALQNIDPDGLAGAWILERFDLVPLLAWALLAAMALDLAVQFVIARAPRLRPALIALAAIAIGSQGLRAWPSRPAADAGIERYGIDLVATPPDGAVVFGTGDHRVFPALFSREVLGEGGSTVYVDASLLAHDWYRARLSRLRPEIDWRPLPLETLGTIWADPRLAQTPVYLANHFSRPSRELDVVPEGIMWRVLPPPTVASRPDAEQLLRRHRAALTRSQAHPSQFAGREAPHLHPFSADAWAAYAGRSQALRGGLLAAGRHDLVRELDALLHDKFGAAATSLP